MKCPRTAAITLAALYLAAAAAAQSAPGAQTPAPDRPAYKFIRQEEDWSKFRAPSEGGDRFDALKHMLLDDDGDVWLSFGGRAEARFESWDGFGFGATNPGNSDEFTLSRLVLHGDLHLGEHVRGFVEGITAQCTERDLPGGERTTDLDTLDLQQGFVDLTTTTGDDLLRLRAGRQTFSFGGQRLVSALPWANTLNRWEGFTGLWSTGRWSVHGLATWYVPVDSTANNERDDDRALYGVYATHAPAPGGPGTDLYLLGDTRPDVTVNGTTGDERRHTAGARGWGPFAEHGDWELEGAYQFGEVGDDSVSAWFVSTVCGWKPAGAPAGLRLFVGLDGASGDSSSGGDVGTFHQLYPLGHAYLGFADTVARQNLLAAQLGASIKPSTATTLSLTAHTLHLMSEDDAIYAVNGTVSRAAPAGGFDSTHIGEEIDVLVQHKLYRHLDVYTGYSHVFTGSAVAETGESDDIDFFYFGAQFTF